MLRIKSLIFFSLFSSFQIALGSPVSINVVVDIDTSDAATVPSSRHHNDFHAIDGPRFSLVAVNPDGSSGDSGDQLFVGLSPIPIFPPRIAISPSPMTFKLDVDAGGNLYIGDQRVSVGPDGMLIQYDSDEGGKVNWMFIGSPNVDGPVLAPSRLGIPPSPFLFTDRLGFGGQIYACIIGVPSDCQRGMKPILLKVVDESDDEVVSKDFTKGFNAQKALEL